MTTTYFLEGAVLGQTPSRPTWDGFAPAHNLVHFCPRCGETWGRVFTHDKAESWFPVNTACSRCPPWRREVPGSFLLDWNHHQLDELPREVLQREFLLHLAHYQRSA